MRNALYGNQLHIGHELLCKVCSIKRLRVFIFMLVGNFPLEEIHLSLFLYCIQNDINFVVIREMGTALCCVHVVLQS